MKYGLVMDEKDDLIEDVTRLYLTLEDDDLRKKKTNKK